MVQFKFPSQNSHNTRQRRVGTRIDASRISCSCSPAVLGSSARGEHPERLASGYPDAYSKHAGKRPTQDRRVNPHDDDRTVNAFRILLILLLLILLLFLRSLRSLRSLASREEFHRRLAVRSLDLRCDRRSDGISGRATYGRPSAAFAAPLNEMKSYPEPRSGRRAAPRAKRKRPVHSAAAAPEDLPTRAAEPAEPIGRCRWLRASRG